MSPLLYAHPDGNLHEVRTGVVGMPWYAGPDGFVLGVTEATAANTGFRVAEASLENYAGSLTNLSPGEVVDRMVITGNSKPSVPGVIYRDSLLLAQNVPTTGVDYYPILDQTSSGVTAADPTVIEHCELRATVRSFRMIGIRGGNFRAHRVKASGLTDFISPHGSSTVVKVVDVEGCFADDFYTDADPNQGDNITHNDWCQAAGMLSRLRIVGSSVGLLGRPRTANVLLQTNQGPYSGEGVILDRNVFRGAATTGSTINVPVDIAVPFVMTNNKIWADGNSPRALISAALRARGTTTISGNVDQNGNPVTINDA